MNEEQVLNTQNIQWFPGHMAKTRRKIAESLSLVDAVAEIVDARIPVSSRNPELAGIIKDKPLLILLNKADMADSAATAKWVSYYSGMGIKAMPVDCRSGRGLNNFVPAIRTLLADKLERYKEKGMAGKPLRIMVAGIPNVGKSSFINRLAGGGRAKVEDRPGVTRGNQWFRVAKDLELLDTPGVLWPKFEDRTVGERLAFTGAVKDNVIDIETLAVRLLECLTAGYNNLIDTRYNVECLSYRDGYEMLCAIGRKRGMLISGGEIDTERAATMVVDEYRGAKLGRITLEIPD